MNVLFLTMSKMLTIEQRGIYTDLMRKFRSEGHNLYIVSPTERRDGRKTMMIEQDGVHILSVKTLNVQKTNVVEKGIGQLSIEYLYKRAIKTFCKGVIFDLILYSTPPITLPNVIRYAKRINPKAITYLLLKDIFPQNAVDMGMLSKTGVKGILYKYFRSKERTLYALSDYIGCMSPANVKYVLEHNPEISADNVEVAPNSIELSDASPLTDSERISILQKYNLPTDKPIFLYGGNLGAPQGIPFLIECLNANKDRKDCHFLVVGNGTYYMSLKDWFDNTEANAATLLNGLPKEEYDQLAKACQVGLIFIDYRFTIPNYPSRLLPYLENRMPVIACTDPICDTGMIASENGYGCWVPSNNVDAFTTAVNKILTSDIHALGENGYKFLKENYLVDNTYNTIMKHF